VNDLVALVLALGLVALGVRVRRREGGPGRRRAVGAFLFYVLAAHAAAGVLQKDAWPITSHTIAVGRARATSRVCRTTLVGVARDGREWPLDPYTFTPVFDSILQYWLEQTERGLAAEDRARVLAFLLDRAERSRQRLAAGARIGPERLLGPAAAPYWLLLPRATEVPAEPWTGLRAYSSCWLPAERLAGLPSERRLIAERLR
jgi:hypothetical protein